MEEECVRGFSDVINQVGLDGYLDVPDWVLARYLFKCIEAYEHLTELVASTSTNN